MAEPRKHHYLPQFYLKGFSADGRSIYQVEKFSPRAYTCSLRDAAEIRDYHELDYSDAEDPHAAEKWLAEIEGKLSAVLHQAVDAGITSAEVHARLISFVSLMRFRVPAVRAFVEEWHRQLVRSTGLILEGAGKFPPIPDGYEDVLSMGNVSISISNWKCLECMFRFAADPKAFQLLASMRPAILRTPDNEYLLTCDQPVAVYHPAASPTDAYGVNLTDSRTELSFPLSSRVLLHLTWGAGAIEERRMTSAEVQEFNRRTIVMADSYVFAPAESDSAKAAVAEHNHCSAGIQLDVLKFGDGYLHLSRIRPVLAPAHYIRST